MTRRIVNVVAPSRLHFGLFSFGNERVRQFGGVGVMINTPSVCLRISRSAALRAVGPHARRALELARRWSRSHQQVGKPNCMIEVLDAPRQHMGLGLGTQLGLSVAAGLTLFFNLPMPSPTELAVMTGRGLRSAVGTYGFAQGGLIVDSGKLAHEMISQLDCRVDMPNAWRFVSICPRRDEGLFGDAERRAFESLPPVAAETTATLQREVRDHLIPAALRADFQGFSDSVYRYGRCAGLCFSQRQGGAYNGPALTDLVDRIRSWGIRGVGQSSWGPTLYVLLPNQQEGEEFVRRWTSLHPSINHDLWIGAPNNSGAVVTVSKELVRAKSVT